MLYRILVTELWDYSEIEDVNNILLAKYHIPKLPHKLLYRHDCEQDQQRWAQNQQCGSRRRWRRWYRLRSGSWGFSRSTSRLLNTLGGTASNGSAISLSKHLREQRTDRTVESEGKYARVRRLQESTVEMWSTVFHVVVWPSVDPVGVAIHARRNEALSLNEFREQRKSTMIISYGQIRNP